jgi:hypothetical protein
MQPRLVTNRRVAHRGQERNRPRPPTRCVPSSNAAGRQTRSSRRPPHAIMTFVPQLPPISLAFPPPPGALLKQWIALFPNPPRWPNRAFAFSAHGSLSTVPCFLRTALDPPRPRPDRCSLFDTIDRASGTLALNAFARANPSKTTMHASLTLATELTSMQPSASIAIASESMALANASLAYVLQVTQVP